VENVIFEVSGGIGKNIMATAVVEGIKKHYKDKNIVVVASYPDIFYNNPNVYRSYNIAKIEYFYEDYVKNKNSIILNSDPYHETGFVNNECHCIESWFRQSGLEYKGEQPQLFTTLMEEEVVYKAISQWNKPLFLIHPFGGPICHGSWVRDMPDYVINDVVKQMKERYTVVQIKLKEQPEIPDTQPLISESIRELCMFVKYSSSRFFIDSFAQHAAAALNISSTVVWPVDKVKKLGHDLHDNIIGTNQRQRAIHLHDAYLHSDDIVGNPQQYPLASGAKIFDTQEIVDSIIKNSVKKTHNSV
jgi:hypothetical protein